MINRREAPCLKVRKVLGEKAVGLVKELKMLEKELKIQEIGDRLFIPLVDRPLPEHIKEFERVLPEFNLDVYPFPQRTKRSPKFFEALKDELPVHLRGLLPRSVDFVGNIAIVEISPELLRYKTIVGEKLLETNERIHTVVAKVGAVEGVYRLKPFEVIAGTSTETIHREHGCRFLLDIKKVYFNPRLSFERGRVSKLVQPNEVIVNLFAGVGCFSIIIAKYVQPVKVYSIDINPSAVQYMKENVRMNRVGDAVIPILGDARQIVTRQLKDVADRVVMQLPETAYDFLDAATLALKVGGGVLHYYTFIEENKFATERCRVLKRLRELGVEGEITHERIIFSIAPRRFEVVFDIATKQSHHV